MPSGQTRILPKDITSYDLLKTLAVLLMFVDHAGYYLFPDAMWMRVVGRMCVPMWFFLIGYARTREIPPKLWVGALILVLANIPGGEAIFPLNILGSMIIVRLLIDRLMEAIMQQRVVFWIACAVMFGVAFWSFDVCEYGLQGLILAMFGYLVRRREQINDDQFIRTFMFFALFAFVSWQIVIFGFTSYYLYALVFGIYIVLEGLWRFEPKTYPELSRELPAPVVGLLHVGGRYTLEIYVLHLLVFKMLAPYYGWGPALFRPEYFQWSWVM